MSTTKTKIKEIEHKGILITISKIVEDGRYITFDADFSPKLGRLSGLSWDNSDKLLNDAKTEIEDFLERSKNKGE